MYRLSLNRLLVFAAGSAGVGISLVNLSRSTPSISNAAISLFILVMSAAFPTYVLIAMKEK